MEKVHAVLDVSFASIIRFFVILLLASILFFSVEILIWFFLALIISVLLNPFVDFLELKKIPRTIGTGVVYIILIIAMIGVVALTAPTIAKEITNIIPEIPVIEEVLRDAKVGDQPLLNLLPLPGVIDENIIREATNIVIAFFDGVKALVVILSLSLFLCIEKTKIKDFIGFVFPKKKEIISYTLNAAQRKIHLWFTTRIIACIFIGIGMYVTLLIAGITASLSLAIIVGILSFIPLLGVIVASVLLLGFISIVNTIYLAIAIFIIFQIINLIADNILMPAISKKVLNVSPALILIAIVIGDHLYGPLGALLAIPVFAITLEFIKIYIKEVRTEKIGDKKKRVIIA